MGYKRVKHILKYLVKSKHFSWKIKVEAKLQSYDHINGTYVLYAHSHLNLSIKKAWSSRQFCTKCNHYLPLTCNSRLHLF